MSDKPSSGATAARFGQPVIYGRNGFGQSDNGPTRQFWMVTFTDLVALMLTFFVLLFSMSRLDEVQWQNMKDSLAEGLDQVSEFRVPVPDEELDIKRVTHVPGDNLDYLASILREHIARSGEITAVAINKREDHLVLSLPDTGLFTDQGQSLSQEGESLLFAIGGLLSSLGNRVEVAGLTGRLPPQDSRVAAYEAALLRAKAVAAGLGGAGYRDDIVLRAYGSARDPSPEANPPAAQSPAIEIIVRADRGEAS